ncbi:hypothetical protein HDU97_006535 [Phlyctochytrium planicorne]|nr:hypothetical protein HDU97_006535 [Phlyctochytrium planicorne]
MPYIIIALLRIHFPLDCHDLGLEPVNSGNVDKHIIVASWTNTPPQVSIFLHGAFYMEGNPIPPEVLSITNGHYEASKNPATGEYGTKSVQDGLI